MTPKVAFGRGNPIFCGRLARVSFMDAADIKIDYIAVFKSWASSWARLVLTFSLLQA
jgi:hypothetical protein